MKKIKLTKGEYVLVDDDDYEMLSKYKWHVIGYKGLYYAARRKGLKKSYMHREIMNAPDKMDVDHIDGNRLNNQKSNLRICSHVENLMNRKTNKNSTSGHRGITFSKDFNKWAAYTKSNGKRYFFGYFPDKESAIKKYEEETKKYLVNFIEMDNNV